MVQPASDVRAVGNYRLYDPIGTGGMGSVFLARLFAPGGFRRIVAIKRLHPHLSEDADFVSAFLDEARLASRIHHPNVVAPLDVVSQGGEVFLVLEYVHGVSLTKLQRLVTKLGESIPPHIAVSLVVDVLNGLHAAHEAKDDEGEPLGLIHRDVSPQNVLVGKDGSARLLDFGVAKAAGRSQSTADGIVKGKRAYMAPEHLLGQSCKESDLYSAGVVLWELLAERRLFVDEETLQDRLSGAVPPWPQDARPISPELHQALYRALSPNPQTRFSSAREMSAALEKCSLATSREIAEWVEHVAEDELRLHAARVARAESRIELEDSPSGVREVDPALIFTNHAPVASLDPALPDSGISVDHAAPKSHRGRNLAIAFVVTTFGALALFAIFGTRQAEVVTLKDNEAIAPRLEVSVRAPVLESSVAPSTASVSPLSSSKVPLGVRGKGRGIRRGKTRDPNCKPYVIDNSGRMQFNEACLK